MQRLTLFFCAVSLLHFAYAQTEDCIYFTNSLSAITVIDLSGNLYVMRDMPETREQTALEIINDVLYIGSGSGSVINMYNISNNLAFLGEFTSFEEGFYIESMVYYSDKNVMLVASDDYPFILEVKMNVTIGAPAHEYGAAIPESENIINGAVWGFNLLKNEQNETNVVILTQSNSIFIKNLDTNSSPLTLAHKYKGVEFGPLRYSGVLTSDNATRLLVSQNRIIGADHEVGFGMNWNGTEVMSKIFYDSGLSGMAKDSTGRIYACGIESLAIELFDNETHDYAHINTIFFDGVGVPWQIRLGKCPKIVEITSSEDSNSVPILPIVLGTVFGAGLICLALIIVVLIIITMLGWWHITHTPQNGYEELLYAGTWDESDISKDPDVDIESQYSMISSLPSSTELTIEPMDTLTTLGISSQSQYPVDQILHYKITLTNESPTNSYDFNFFVPTNNHFFNLKLHPGTGTLAPGETIFINIEFELLATTTLKKYIRCEFKKSKNKSTDVFYWPFSIEGELSTKLDPDDIEMKLPAIGRGGFATVYRGKYRGADVAVKVLNRQKESYSVSEFELEIELMTKLRSPHVLNFIGACHAPGKLCLVTEYCKYGSTRDLFFSPSKKITFGYLLRAAKDMAKGVHFLHTNGVIHRDIKPENFMITSLSYGAPVVSKIADFGTSKTTQRPMEAYAHSKGWGTPVYMAPELLQIEEKEYSAKVDVFSFGITLWTLFHRCEPYLQIGQAWDVPRYVIGGGRPIIIDDCPKSYVEILQSCWDIEPDERPEMSEVVKLLRNLGKNSKFKQIILTVPESSDMLRTASYSGDGTIGDTTGSATGSRGGTRSLKRSGSRTSHTPIRTKNRSKDKDKELSD